MKPEIELLVADWFRRARESQRVHYECGTYYSRLNYLLGIPTIVLTAGVGTAVFASFEKMEVGYTKLVLGLVSITAAVLASLQTFLSFGQRADRHRLTGSRYGAVRRSLEFLKTFPPENDDSLRQELEKIKKEMDDLAQNAPHVPSRLKTRVDDELKSREHRRIFHLPGKERGQESSQAETGHE